MRLISAVSGVQIPAPPPSLWNTYILCITSYLLPCLIKAFTLDLRYNYLRCNMEIAGFIIPLAILIVIAALIAIIAFLSGKKEGVTGIGWKR
jgi:hypothetical protein